MSQIQDINEKCVGPSSEQAGKVSSCAGCPNQSACSSGASKQVDPNASIIDERILQIKNKILVLSGKGGMKNIIILLLSLMKILFLTEYQ